MARKDFNKDSGFIQILDRCIAECPGREAIVFGDWRITYESFARYINMSAHMLAAAGIGKGDCVGIISRNRPEFLILEFSLYKLGAVPVKINWRLAPGEMIMQLEASHVKTAFIQVENPDWGAQLFSHYAGALSFFTFEGSGERDSSFIKLISAYPDSEDFDVRLRDDAPACHMHTSGTTGHAKTVVYTHGGMLDKMSAVKDLYGYRPGDKLQFISQLFHSAAIGAWLCFCTCGTLVLMSSFSTEQYMQSLQREHINAISVVPTILKWILDELDKKPYDLSSLHTIRYSTCPVSPALLERAMKRLDCEFYQSYGMTEMGSMVSILVPADHLDRGLSHLNPVGRAIPGTEIRIIGEDGKPCPPGTVGEICIRGQGAMKEYYGQPELTRAHMLDGWYFSGDMGYLDERGYLTLSGRKDDLIISGGENIYPSEISNVLMQIDEISECCVFGVPDEIWGEHVKACVVLAPGSTLTKDALFDYCRRHIPHFKAPKEIEILPSLPKNTTGKVELAVLKRSTVA